MALHSGLFHRHGCDHGLCIKVTAIDTVAFGVIDKGQVLGNRMAAPRTFNLQMNSEVGNFVSLVGIRYSCVNAYNCTTLLIHIETEIEIDTSHKFLDDKLTLLIMSATFAYGDYYCKVPWGSTLNLCACMCVCV